MSKNNLIANWLANDLATPGRRKCDCVADLNRATGSAYTTSRINEWAQGLRQPGSAAQRYMAREAVAYVLSRELGSTLMLTDRQLDRIADGLSKPCLT